MRRCHNRSIQHRCIAESAQEPWSAGPVAAAASGRTLPVRGGGPAALASCADAASVRLSQRSRLPGVCVGVLHSKIPCYLYR